MNKKINSIALSILLVTSTFTLFGAFTLFPQQAEAQGLQLRVSAAERPQFQNHFFGPQIVQIVIDDPGATDPDESTVGLQVLAVTTPRVHLADGLWYSYVAEDSAFAVLIDVLTDGVRNNSISVSDAVNDSGATATLGGAVYTIVTSVNDSFVKEIEISGGLPFVELNQADIFTILPTPFFEGPAGVINPDLKLPDDNAAGSTNEQAGAGDNLCSSTGAAPGTDGSGLSSGTGTGDPDCDWPYIKLIGIEELDSVQIRAGTTASVILTYDDFSESIASSLDRSAAYPLFAEVIIQYTDFMSNINPVEEDGWWFALSTTTGTSTRIFYQPVGGFDPDGAGGTAQNFADVLPVLFRPVLNFDTRQILELDTEGVNTLRFIHAFSQANNQVVSFAGEPFTRISANARLACPAGPPLCPGTQFTGAEIFSVGTATSLGLAAAGDLQPVVRMFETDPNTNVMISTVEPQGGRSVLFTGVNDRVANFDYFDIINSAPMTTHDGFTTVDRELYDSADRSVFTTTDADQNLRSRISEQPSAIRSNSFVPIGSPFPLGNNPTFDTFFGKDTLPTNTLGDGNVNQFDFEQVGGTQDIYGPDGLLGTGDDVGGGVREGIEQAVFILAFDADDAADGVIDNAAGAVAAAAAIKTAVELELNTGTGGGAFVSVATTASAATTPGYTAIPLPGAGARIRIDVPPAAAEIFNLDLDNDGLIETNTLLNTGEAMFLATSADVAQTNPQRAQTIGLDFNTGTIGGDNPSGVIVNSRVNLGDLNKFTEFTATGTQITSNGIAALVPFGQAFPVDPIIAGTAVWTTTLSGTPAAGSTVTNGAANAQGLGVVTGAATVYRVMAPLYNLMNFDLTEIIVAAEVGTNDNFNNVAVQLKVDDLGVSSVIQREIVTRLVDLTPFDVADVSTAPGAFTVGLVPTTKLGIGSIRVVDFLAQDWDDDGLFWPNDTNEPFATLNVQVSLVFVDTNTLVDPSQNEPAEVIVPGNNVAAVDFAGIFVAVPPVAVAGGVSSFPAQRTIDEVTLLASEHFVYRIQVKEQGSNSSIFTGRMDFITANQFDTTQKALQDVVASGDPAKALMPNRFIPPNRLSFAYTDVDIVAVFRPVSASFIYETRDGNIEWDRGSYSFGQDAFLTITDEDLNRKPDASERFDLPVAGFVFFELGKQRVVDNSLNGFGAVVASFFAQIDATLLETGPNTGTYVAQITMPTTITVSSAPGADNLQGSTDDTVTALVAVQQQDLEANYIDVRDRSSIRQEFDDIANIRTTLGDVVLDRAAYPPGALQFIEIHDNDFNQDVDIRETIDLRQLVITTDFTAASGYGVAHAEGDVIGAAGQGTCTTFAALIGAACGGASPSSGVAPIVEVTIFRTGTGRLATLLPAGLLDPAFATGTTGLLVAGGTDRFGIGILTTATFNILPMLDRNGNAVVTALETGPNTGIFEFEIRLPGPAFDVRFPVRLPAVLTSGTVLAPVIQSNQPIQVTYTDRADESGEAEDEEELATFLTNTARLRTDKLEYGLGDRVDIIIEEPDFNLDSRSVDQVDFSILDIVTDKVDTEFGANAATQHFGTVVTNTPVLRTNLTQFRETNFNSGVFVVAIEELVRDLIDRGEVARLLYFDRTPSGGGSEIRVQYTFLVVAILPEIVFDKEEYTPFDEVTVSIISPDSNNDPDRIETIQPLISSSSESLGRKSFPETGPSTGIFEEDFDLSPDRTRFPGDIRAIREDGITVEFRIDSDTVATKSVFVNYHVGQVMFDKDAFRMNERGVLRTIDPDANINPDTIDTLSVRFWSTTDRGGLLVTLRETGDRTGIFEEIITFTPDEESSGTRLRVSEGDTVTSKYTDNTLPAPAALDGQSTFTVEVEELFASALIGAIVPPLERAVASEPVLVDQTGATITEVSVGSQVLIQSTITNSQTKKQPFAYIVQIKDKNGVTISLSWVTGELPAKESLAAAQSWIPGEGGEYTIEVFVWESVDKPEALSPVRTSTVNVS